MYIVLDHIVTSLDKKRTTLRWPSLTSCLLWWTVLPALLQRTLVAGEALWAAAEVASFSLTVPSFIFLVRCLIRQPFSVNSDRTCWKRSFCSSDISRSAKRFVVHLNLPITFHVASWKVGKSRHSWMGVRRLTKWHSSPKTLSSTLRYFHIHTWLHFMTWTGTLGPTS